MNTNRQFKDNSKQVVEELKSFIRAYAPPMNEYYERIKSESTFNPLNVTLEFYDKEIDCRVTVYVRTDKSWNYEEDEFGNDWQVHQVRAEVDWSAYGSTNPVLALKRLNFMTCVANFAMKLEQAFPNEFFTLAETAQEKSSKAAQAAAVRAAKAHTKSLRIGGSRVIVAPPEANMDGEYPFSADNKTYSAFVSNGMITVMRNS